jgi:hypothetical protein
MWFRYGRRLSGFLGTSSEDSQQKQALNMLEPAYRDYMFAECIATDDPRLKEK